MTVATAEMGAMVRLDRDLQRASQTLSDDQIRWLVSMYYWAQDGRKRAGNQINASLHLDDETEPAPEPHEVIAWVFGNMDCLEANIKKALDAYTSGQVVGRWARSIPGIGPVLAAGLMAHIDIARCPTAGHIWRFAGLDPTVEWLGTERAGSLVKEIIPTRRVITADDLVEIANRTNRKLESIVGLAASKKTGKVTATSLAMGLAKRPWNADLKVLCWKVGESFMKVSSRPNDIYGKVYLARKEYENAKNARGEYADQAAAKLAQFNIKDKATRETYAAGKLPAGHIIARCKRYAAKLFLAHLHHVMYEVRYHEAPPKPYILNQPGHSHFIAPPNWPME